MSDDWVKGRTTVLLSEAWERALPLPPIMNKANELRSELPPDWSDDETQALALEITFSEAGLSGDLAFRGLAPDGHRADIPSTYFNPHRVNGFTLHRGFDPEVDAITFPPVHDLQDEAFDSASQQTAQQPELYYDWQEVEVVAQKLAAFLDELHSPDKARRAERDCTTYLIEQRQSHPAEPLRREEYEAHCQQEWPALTARGFKRAWDKAREKTPSDPWDKPGPRRKSTRTL